jgi:hypothetical protein
MKDIPGQRKIPCTYHSLDLGYPIPGLPLGYPAPGHIPGLSLRHPKTSQFILGVSIPDESDYSECIDSDVEKLHKKWHRRWWKELQ